MSRTQSPISFFGGSVCPRGGAAAAVHRLRREADQYEARMAHGARRMGRSAARAMMTSATSRYRDRLIP